MAGQAPALALDIGGTKIAAGIVDAKGQLLHHNRQPTPTSADPDEVWSVAERTIADALAAATGDVCGVVRPGLPAACRSSASPAPSRRARPIRW